MRHHNLCWTISLLNGGGLENCHNTREGGGGEGNQKLPKMKHQRKLEWLSLLMQM